MAANFEALQQEAEWRACSRNLRYFLENYWHIQWIDERGRMRGWRLFKLRDYQLEDLKLIERALAGDEDAQRQVWLKARQIGMTTLLCAAAFWSLYFNPDQPWLITSQTEDDAKDTMNLRIKVPYTKLPQWMRDRGPELLDNNKERMSFKNGSSVLSIPATETAGRSKSSFGWIMDESAHVEDADGLYGGVEPQTYGPIFAVSSANGMGNFFHDKWLDSQRSDHTWIGTFHPWHVVPHRDEKWYNRKKREYRGRLWLFYQEYPATPTEAFAKSGRTALSMDLVNDQPYCEPEARYDVNLIDFESEFVDFLDQAVIPADDDRDIELWVWEHPYLLVDEDDGRLLQKPNFVVSVDVAEGLEHGDRSSFVVWDANTLEVVATSLSHIPVEDIGEFAEWLGYWYFTALIMVERNNHGLLPNNYLQNAQYPRLYRMEKFAQRREGKTGKYQPRYGWHTNKASKPKMINDFNKALRDDVLRVYDERFRQEAATFISDGKGGYEASSGNHDDHLIAHLIGYQGCINIGEYPIVWENPDPGPTTWGDVANLTLPKPPEDPLSQRLGQRERKTSTVTSFYV